ncbi:hypothetical protein EBU95_06575 [bacterium]|nr:hypothetical protein [bacterium]
MKFLNLFIFGLYSLNFYSFSKEEANLGGNKVYDCTEEICKDNFTLTDTYNSIVIIGGIAYSYKILEDIKKLLEDTPFYTELTSLKIEKLFDPNLYEYLKIPITDFEKQRRVVVMSAGITTLSVWALVSSYDLLKRQYYRYVSSKRDNISYKTLVIRPLDFILISVGIGLLVSVVPTYFEESRYMWECYKYADPILRDDRLGYIPEFDKLVTSVGCFLKGSLFSAASIGCLAGGLYSAQSSITYSEEGQNAI